MTKPRDTVILSARYGLNLRCSLSKAILQIRALTGLRRRFDSRRENSRLHPTRLRTTTTNQSGTENAVNWFSCGASCGLLRTPGFILRVRFPNSTRVFLAHYTSTGESRVNGASILVKSLRNLFSSLKLIFSVPNPRVPIDGSREKFH